MPTSDIKKGPLYVDSTNNRVGVGTSSPSHPLTVDGQIKSIGTNGETVQLQTSSQYTGISFIGSDGTRDAIIDYDHTNGVMGLKAHTAGHYINFLTGGYTERFRITDNGVTFNGDTAAANALDDYEEGTWTASYTGGSTLSGGNQTCRYTKIGNLVQITGNIYYTSVSGGSGDLKVTGFPFTQSSGSVYYSTATIAAANWSSQAPVQANLVNTQLSLFYGGGTSPNSAIQVSNLVPYAEIYFSITYVTDS